MKKTETAIGNTSVFLRIRVDDELFHIRQWNGGGVQSQKFPTATVWRRLLIPAPCSRTCQLTIVMPSGEQILASSISNLVQGSLASAIEVFLATPAVLKNNFRS